MINKEQIVITADKLTNIFKKNDIKWSTGMKSKYKYACIEIPVGKPTLDEKTGQMVQKVIKRYLDQDITALLRSSKRIKSIR